jgi:hypothetical protein
VFSGVSVASIFEVSMTKADAVDQINFNLWHDVRFEFQEKLLISVYNVRFQVLTAASRMFRAVFWVVLPCKMIVEHSVYNIDGRS